MSTVSRTTTTPGEALVVITICFGWAVLSSLDAVASGFPSGGTGAAATFTDRALLGIVVYELVLGTVALTVLRSRSYAISTLMPHPSIKDSALGLGLFFAAWVVGATLTSVFSAGQLEQPIEQMVRQANVSLPVVIIMAMVNGTFEEVFLLGFLQRGLRNYGHSVALGVTLLIRLMYHLYQGPIGAVWVLGFGLVFGLFYLRFKSLWPVALAHILWDIVPFTSSQH